MNEKPKFPDHLSRPDYWLGHGPTDTCERTYYSSILDASKEEQKWLESLKTLYYNLSKWDMARFLAAKSSLSGRNFGPGTVFDAANFEAGTIIGIKEEFGHWRDGNFDEYTDYTVLGVVCEPKKGQGIGRAIALYFPDLIGHTYISFREPVIEVRKARHSKTYHDEIPNHDHVTKVNGVEILYAGKGTRKGKGIRNPFSNLAPNPQLASS